MKKLLGLLLVLFMFVGCTDNQRVKKYGGTQKIELESGQRLVNVTWKDANIWILTKEDSTIKPIVYTFKEKSNRGIVEGTIFIYEK
jgi:uncharacterized protein YcfL